MFNDQQRQDDKQKSAPKGDEATDKARENVALLNDAMEREIPKVEFAQLGWDTDAQYDPKTDTITLPEDYRNTMTEEPALLEPLLAHECVHASYQSETPKDEVSLQTYIAEEMVAYQAEYAAWQEVKPRYASSERRSVLSPTERELIARYEFKMNHIDQVGWENYRSELEARYRLRLNEAR